MGDFRYATGRFARRTTTGTQTVTGIADALGPFTPKGIIMWSTMLVGNASDQYAWQWMGLSDGARAYAMSLFMNSGEPGPFFEWPRCQTNPGPIVSINSAPQTVTEFATTTLVPITFDEGQFTIIWQASLTATPFDINYLVFGGADLSIVCGSALEPPAIANYAVNTPAAVGQITGLLVWTVPGINFHNYALPVVVTAEMPGLGFTDGTRQGVTAGNSLGGGETGLNAKSRQWTDHTVLRINQPGGPIGSATIVSLGVDTFTLHYDAFGASEFGDAGFFYLAIAGPQVRVGADTSPTAPGPTSIALPFTPGAALALSTGYAATTDANLHNRMSLGAVTPLAQVNTWIGELTGQTQSDRARYASDATWIYMGEPVYPSGGGLSPFATASAAIAPGAITLTWGAADATARQFLYVAFEGAPAPPPPPGECVTPFCIGDGGGGATLFG